MIESVRIITLLTDFGIKDAYVSAIKGVILGICPNVTLVDISHSIPKHNILEGAFILSQVSPFFPKGTIHLVVVDPGVGTMRKRMVIQGSHSLYVGPDNGVLSLAAQKEGVVKVFEIKNKTFLLPDPSKTFEGRDVFAPVAAHLARGVAAAQFGPEISTFTDLQISRPVERDGMVLGEVIHIDGFGNITTNIPVSKLKNISIGAYVEITVNKISKISSFCLTYDEQPLGSLLLLLGSSDFLEIAINQGSAKALFKAKVGNMVTILPL